MKTIITYSIILFGLAIFIGCGGSESSDSDQTSETTTVEEDSSDDPMNNKGIGPISSVTLGDIDQTLVAEGEAQFTTLCSACHKLDKRFVGPALADVLDRRSPEWVMNMILNPEEMTQKDPLAKALLIEFNGAPMANQNLSKEDARAVLEYFRTLK